MAKQNLSEQFSVLESQIIDTMLVSLKKDRSDLSYPESWSDMQSCVRGLLTMFRVERSPLPIELQYEKD